MREQGEKKTKGSHQMFGPEHIKRIMERIEDDLSQDMKRTFGDYSELLHRFDESIEIWNRQIDDRVEKALERNPQARAREQVLRALHKSSLARGPIRWMRAGFLLSICGGVEDLLCQVVARVNGSDPNGDVKGLLKKYGPPDTPLLIRVVHFLDERVETAVSEMQRIEVTYLSRIRNSVCHNRGRMTKEQWLGMETLARDVDLLRGSVETNTFAKSLIVNNLPSGAVRIALGHDSPRLALSLLKCLVLNSTMHIPVTSLEKKPPHEPQ